MHEQAANDLTPGTTIEKYRVEGVIGRGGMATVYRVRHVHLDSLHALKLLHVSSPGIRQRLMQEGRVQASLRHPNILPVTDVVVGDDGCPGLVMEFVDGPSLEQLLRARSLTIEQIDVLGRGVLLGVSAAHQRGLIHRDLKPANVLLVPTSHGLQPKVTDFGLVKVRGGEGGMTQTRSGQMMGTPCYMAPEQFRDTSKVDHRADIFALGAVLYELATGQRAFDGGDLIEVLEAVRAERRPDPRALRPDLPPRMAAAIDAALAVDPAQRPESCAALLAIWSGQAAAGSRSAGPWDASILQEASSMGSGSDLGARPQSDTWGSDTFDMVDTRGGDTIAPIQLNSGELRAMRAPSRETFASLFHPAPAGEERPAAGGATAVPAASVPPQSVPPQSAPPQSVPPAAPSAPSSAPSMAPQVSPAPAASGGGAGRPVAIGALVVVALLAGVFGGRLLQDPPEPTSGAPATDASAVNTRTPASPEGAADPGEAAPEGTPEVAAEAAEGGAAEVAAAAAEVATDRPSTARVAADEVSQGSADPVAAEAAPPPVAPPPAPTDAASGAETDAGTASAGDEASAEQEGAAAAAGMVRLSGTATTIWLNGAAGRFPPGPVPAGLYTIEAIFPAEVVPDAGQVQVVAGQELRIKCDATFVGCQQEP